MTMINVKLCALPLILSFLFSQSILPSLFSPYVNAAHYQERRRPQADLGLQIIISNRPSEPLIAVFEGKITLHLIRRESLNVVNPQLAEDFTAIDIWVQKQLDSIKVRLALVYNDLSDQHWRNNRKENIVGEYLLPERESVYTSDLAQYGIEPFEMRAVSGKPVKLQPGEGPQIINNTTALEVVSLERSLDRYELTLKNTSSKNVIAYTLSYGDTGQAARRVDYGAEQSLIPAGGLYLIDGLHNRLVDSQGIIIKAVFFDDGTFEGDRTLGLDFQARREGVRIQSPYVLRVIEQALMQSTDADLEKAFYELEAGLWKIPEAIDKMSALKFLQLKYPSLGEAEVSSLYERLKDGLYEARNMALSPLGDLKRQIEDEKNRDDGTEYEKSRAERIRRRITELKEDFENLINKLKENAIAR